jgi:hypothetical protein
VRFFLPLRVGISPAYRRVRRVSPRQGESLSFVASNESNQSKDALHFAVPLRLLPSATCHPRSTSDHGTPVQSTPPLSSLRIAITPDAKRGVLGSCEATTVLLFGPRGWRRGAQGFGAARDSALRQLTSRGCLSAAAEGREASSARGPKDRAPQSSRPQADRHRRVPLSLVTFFRGSERKLLPCRGHIPTSASRSEKKPHAHARTAKGTRATGLSSCWYAKAAKPRGKQTESCNRGTTQ